MRALSRRGFGLAALAVLAAYAGCAHIRPLDGGPADKTPPELLEMVPTDSSRGLGPLPVLRLRFSEALYAASASGAIRTYPALPRPDVRARGSQLEVRYRDSLPPDTTLVVVVGKALQDAQGRDNKLAHELWFVFATGDTLHGAAVLGRVTVKGKPEPQAVLRFEPVGLPSVPDSATTRRAPARRPRFPVAATDAEGLFTLLGLPTGTPFLLRAFVDRNSSFDLDEGELAAAYPETLRLAPGEVRRGLEWNLVDPNEPGQVHGVVFNRTATTGPIAVALQALDVDSSAAKSDSLLQRSATAADTLRPAATASLDSLARRSVATRDSVPVAPAADTLPVAPQGSWEAAYAALGALGPRHAWQIVYASPRGDYSIRVRPGRHQLAAFVDVSGDSLPGTCVAADSTRREWEPLWVGGVLEVAPAADVRARAIDIDTPH